MEPMNRLSIDDMDDSVDDMNETIEKVVREENDEEVVSSSHGCTATANTCRICKGNELKLDDILARLSLMDSKIESSNESQNSKMDVIIESEKTLRKNQEVFVSYIQKQFDKFEKRFEIIVNDNDNIIKTMDSNNNKVIAAFGELHDRVDNLTARTEALETYFTSLSQQVENLSKQVTNLSQQVANALDNRNNRNRCCTIS